MNQNGAIKVGPVWTDIPLGVEKQHSKAALDNTHIYPYLTG